MAEDKGYWFTTDTGVHVHVEPGETKEQAMKRKFGYNDYGLKEKKNREYLPHGGWDEKTRYYTEGKNGNLPEYSHTLVKYNGYVGEESVMMSKFGRTKNEFQKDVATGIEGNYPKMSSFGYNIQNQNRETTYTNILNKGTNDILKNNYKYGRNIDSGALVNTWRENYSKSTIKDIKNSYKNDKKK